jgi:MoxR-like ATPase
LGVLGRKEREINRERSERVRVYATINTLERERERELLGFERRKARGGRDRG